METNLTFRFHDGRRHRTIDPIVVLSRLAKCSHYRPALIDDAINADPLAVLLVSETALHAFNVKLLNQDDRGLTRLDCVQLLHRFDRWILSLGRSSQR